MANILPRNRKHAARALVFMLLCSTSACKVGPDYKRASAPEAPPSYKETMFWKLAQPRDNVIRAKWWEVFGDPALNALEEQVEVTNQNVLAAAANYRQAKALVDEARAQYYPTVTANAGATRSQSGSGRGGAISTATTTSTTATGTGSTVAVASGGSTTVNNFTASLGASWEPDIWGRIGRTVESNAAAAQASAADLASATLSARAALAIDYLNLRVSDDQKRVLDNSVAAYKRALELTENQYKVGVAARSDVLQAKVQLESTETQDLDVGVLRAQYEHAIAVLIGKSPSSFSIEATNNVPPVPAIPTGVPSELLERRPDIAGAERRMAAANAEIGVAESAYYPDLTLSASGGFASSTLANWFSLPNRFWSLGSSLADTVFDAGLRAAQVEAASAAYDQTVATYRQTVLAGFQQVEDNLAALRILDQEANLQKQTVADARQSVTIALNQYKAGTINYLNVVTVQTAELNNELTAITIERSQLTAAATLIEALGGGWNENELAKLPDAGSASAQKPAK